MAPGKREIIGPHPAIMLSLICRNPIIYLGLALMFARKFVPDIVSYVTMNLPGRVPSIEILGVILAFGGLLWVFLVFQATNYYSDGENLFAEDGVIIRRNNMIPTKMLFDSDLRKGILERLCRCGTIIFKLADGDVVQLHFVVDPETVRHQAMSKARAVGVV